MRTRVEAWHTLVHACQRWRSLVFESRRRLNLRLYCAPKTPARDKLDVWPALPLLVFGNAFSSGTDNIIAALGQTNRVRQVNLYIDADWQLERVLAAMQGPFPELTHLHLDKCQSFPIRSWVDLPHVCDPSNWMAYHFRDFQSCFRLLLNLSASEPVRRLFFFCDTSEKIKIEQSATTCDNLRECDCSGAFFRKK